jgi:hypothetical protein
MLNNEQLKGMGERLATIIATWFLLKMVQRGFISSEDSGILLPGLVVVIVAMPSLAYGWWVNRSKALQQAASNTFNPDGTKPIIVTSAAIAASTSEANIVSSATNKVVTEGEVVTKPASVVVEPPKESHP